MALRIVINRKDEGRDSLETLFKMAVEAPGLVPWMLGVIAGRANPIAQRGAFGGSVPGFAPRTSGPTTTLGAPGDAQKIGLKASFKLSNKTAMVSLWSPWANLFENFKRRPQVHILKAAKSDIESSGVIMKTVEDCIKAFEEGRTPDLSNYAFRNTRRHRR